MARIGNLASAQEKRAAEHKKNQKKRNIHYDVGPYWKTQNKTSQKKASSNTKQSSSVPFRDLMLPNQVAITRFTPGNVKKADETIKKSVKKASKAIKSEKNKILQQDWKSNYQKSVSENQDASTGFTCENVKKTNKIAESRKGKFSPAELTAGMLFKGINQAEGGLTQTADWLVGNSIKGVGKLAGKDWSDNPVHLLNKNIHKEGEKAEKYFSKNTAKGGKVAKTIDKYGTMTAAAIPSALVALATAGGSTAEQGLQAAAGAGEGTLNALSNALTKTAKDPNYWTAFLQVAGDSYKNAKKDGASEAKANLYGMSNGLLNALVEVGGDTGNGGIQTFPKQMQKGGSALKNWVSSMVDEGKENVVQGAIERGLQNLVYGKKNKLYVNGFAKDTNSSIAKMNKLSTEWNAMNNGNVDYNNRHYVNPDVLYSAGWNSEKDKKNLEGNIATTYTQGFYGSDFGTTASGQKNTYIEITPIQDNGKVLSPEQLENYVKKIYATGDVVKADKVKNGGLGIVVNYWDHNPTDKEFDEYFTDLDKVKQAHLRAWRDSKKSDNSSDNAIFNPKTALQEFGSGALVGGLVGGGQILAGKTANALSSETKSDTPVLDAVKGTAKGAGQSDTPILDAVTKDNVQTESETPVLDSVRNATAKKYADILTSKSDSALRNAESTQGQPAANNTSNSKAVNSSTNSAREAIASMLVGGKRVDVNTLNEAQFDAAADSGAMMDAENRVYIPDAQEHIDNRNVEDVGSRKLNAFQFDHPEVHQYYQEAAKDLIQDASVSLSYPQIAHKELTVNGKQWSRETQASPALREAMDETELSRNDIIKAAQLLVEDHGQENNAAAKRLELVLDDMLTNGYTTMDGRSIAPNESYISAKANIPGFDETSEADKGHALDDIDRDLGAANSGFDPYTHAQNEYGNIAPGENPSRIVDVPLQTEDNNQVSKTARTVMEASATPDSRLPTVEDAVTNGKLTYVPVANMDTSQRAEQQIQTDGWQKSLTDWTAEVRSGKTSADLTAIGATLVNNAGNSDMDGRQYTQLLSDYSQMLRNGGQAVQAARILKKISPEGRLYMIQQTVESLAKKWAGKYDVNLDPALVDEYRSAQTDTERDEVIGKIQQNIADQIPSTLSEKFTALRYTNMLGNFKTQVRNVLGNAGMQPVRIAKDKIGAVLEAAADAASGGKIHRTKSFLTSPSMFREAWADFENVQNEAMGEGKYEDYVSDGEMARDIQDKRTIFKNNGNWGTNEEDNVFLKGLRKTTDVGWKALETYRKATNWTMEHGDIGFSRFTYADAMAGYLQSNGIKSVAEADADTLDNARSYAIQQAQEATYRDTNAFSKFVTTFDKDWGKTARTITQGILPFRKTPADVLARAEEYSPLGIINTSVDAVKAAKGSTDVSATDVIDALAKTITGTGLAGLGYALFNEGIIRGKDDDDKKQANFDDLLGHQAYSIELPNGTSLTLDWLAPESMPFFVGAQFAKAAGINGLSFSDGLNAVAGITDPMLNMSMLQGVNDALDNIKYVQDGSSLANLVGNSLFSYLSQGITNSLLGQAEYASEKERQTTYTDKNSQLPTNMQYTLGRLSQRIPGWDYHQTNYIDAWGRKENQGSTAERIFNNFLNPSYVSDVKVRPVEEELQRIADQTGNTSVFPQKEEKTVTIDGEQINLNATQYNRLAQQSGQEKYSLLNDAMKSSWYKNMSDEERSQYIGTVYQYATSRAKQAVVPSYETDAWVQNAQSAQRDIGATPAQYLAYRQKYGSRMMSGSGYEKVKEAIQSGMTVDQYMNMHSNIDSNDNGSVSQKEAQSYLDTTKFSRDKKAEIWGIINKGWKRNPYK